MCAPRACRLPVPVSGACGGGAAAVSQKSGDRGLSALVPRRTRTACEAPPVLSSEAVFVKPVAKRLPQRTRGSA